MNETHDNQRLNDILDMIGRIAALDFSREIEVSDNHDMVDAIALGLNMLSEELNSQVVDKRRLDEVNEKLEKFAYTAAHDLKSPLNSQEGLIRLLELYVQPKSGNEVYDIITKMKSINEKMKLLVAGILNYSLSQSKDMEKEAVDLNELLKEVIEVDDFTSRADINVKSTLPVVTFNRTGGIQVFRNIMDNAIKYSDKDRCKIEIESNEFDDFYEISINDNGPGISSEHHQTIFELFNQVRTSGKSIGSGIGLATTKNIIEAAGGKIWLESEEGRGATFIFTLKKHT